MFRLSNMEPFKISENPDGTYDIAPDADIEGNEGLRWSDESILESGKTGFYLVYSPKTHQVLFTHLTGPNDRSLLEVGDRDNGYRLLGPLPRPPVYVCPGTKNGFIADPDWHWE